MAALAASIAQFIRHLGYRAIPAGNGTALSIPMAVDAGLGHMGRNGLLITRDYGPCVRLCKVITDLPLAYDPPVEYGLMRTCEQCNRCAAACPGGAISHEPAPTFKVTCRSNNPGLKRWAVNAEKCYQFWVDNGADCSQCIAVCPFTQRAIKKQSMSPSTGLSHVDTAQSGISEKCTKDSV